MARVDVEEIGAERLLDIVGETEAKQVDIERHHLINAFNRQHDMAKPKRSGAEAGNRAARRKWRVVDFGAIKSLTAVAGGIVERNQRANAPCIRERLRLDDELHF